jgi:hypothetical protein
VSTQEAVLRDVGGFFRGPVHWSQNDAWYVQLRERTARGIVALKQKRK